jgi:hypothetical protein
MKLCEICGKELAPKQKKFCSDECRKQVPRVYLYSKICPECGKEYQQAV